MLFRRLDQLNRPSRSSCRSSWRLSHFCAARRTDHGRHACSSIARGASTLLLWVCGRHACCSIARGASTLLLCVRVRPPRLCVTYESACVCVCGLRAAIDRRRVGPIEENKNYGEARAGGRCVNSTQLCRLVRHNYHAEQIDGQYKISVSIDNTSTSMLGLLCR